MCSARRVVVTGSGVVTPIGNDVPSFWSAIKQGRSGLGPLQHIDGEESYSGDLQINIACQVKDFDAQTRLANRPMQGSDRYVQFAGAAAAEAFAQSQLELPLVDGSRAGCISAPVPAG